MENTDIEVLTKIVREIENNLGSRVDRLDERVPGLENDVEQLRRRITNLEER